MIINIENMDSVLLRLKNSNIGVRKIIENNWTTILLFNLIFNPYI